MNKTIEQYLILYLLLYRDIAFNGDIRGQYSFDHNNTLSKLNLPLDKNKEYIYRYSDIYKIDIPFITLDNLPKTLDSTKLELYNNIITNYKYWKYKVGIDFSLKKELINWIILNCTIFIKIKPKEKEETNFVDITLNVKECINNFKIEKNNLLEEVCSSFLYNNTNKDKYNFLARDLNNNVYYNITSFVCHDNKKELFFYTFDIYEIVRDSISISYWKRKDLVSTNHKEEINDINKFANSF